MDNKAGRACFPTQVFRDALSDKSSFVNFAIDGGDRFPHIMQKNGEREGWALSGAVI